jgi:hypothetical protein
MSQGREEKLTLLRQEVEAAIEEPGDGLAPVAVEAAVKAEGEVFDDMSRYRRQQAARAEVAAAYDAMSEPQPSVEDLLPA